MDGRRRTWDGRAGVAAALCLIGLAAVVAATSRATAHGGGGAVHIGSTTGHALTTLLLTAGFVVWIAATTVLVRALWPAAIRRRKRDPEDDLFEPYRPEVRWWEKAIVVALPLLVIAGALAAVILTGRGGGTPAQTAILGNPFGSSPGARVATAHPAPAATSGSTLAIALAAAVAIAIVAAVALIFIRRRNRPVPKPPPSRPEPELAAALDWSLDDLRREPDPRRAVIAAYARMERLLGDRGVGRHRWEAPLEYLGRALARLPGGERSMAELTSLFHEARFGPHAIGEPDRARAVRLLTALRRELGDG